MATPKRVCVEGDVVPVASAGWEAGPVVPGRIAVLNMGARAIASATCTFTKGNDSSPVTLTASPSALRAGSQDVLLDGDVSEPDAANNYLRVNASGFITVG